MFQSGEMPMFLSKGPVFLSKGFLEDIHKWRLITLLNTSYKIFAKLLSFRLQELQPKIIHESQTRFMWERSIMDNGLTNILGGHCTRSENQTKPNSVV